MNFPERTIVSGPRSFVSEKELDERRRKRQEEWEKSRKPDDPEEAPEEEYDHRTLYERLQENKMKKEAEVEEAHKLKNMIRGLDSDEVAFLEHVDQAKLDQEEKKYDEEEREIEEFKKASDHLTQEEQAKKVTEFTKSMWKSSGSGKQSAATSGRKSQQASLLERALKRKTADEKPASPEEQPEVKKKSSAPSSGTLKCIGVLPGIGGYGPSDSSDSENSDSDSDLERGGDFMLIPKVFKSNPCNQ